MAITKLVLNGTSYDLGSITYNIDTLNTLTGPEDYAGVEIAEDWANIQTAAQAGTTSTLNNGAGLRVGDYKTITTTSGTTIVCQVAGIDTYYRCGSTEQSHHVDFISKDCWPTTVVWNESTTEPGNNGTSDTTNPFMASYVYSYLEDVIYADLPSDLTAVIAQKQLYAETRYSSSGLISDSTGVAWITMPHLWLPTEYEVFGSTILGTQGYSARDAVQYPIFANNWYHRIKGSSNGGGRCNWWLATPYFGGSAGALGVHNGGFVNSYPVTYATARVPVCFRVC